MKYSYAVAAAVVGGATLAYGAPAPIPSSTSTDPSADGGAPPSNRFGKLVSGVNTARTLLQASKGSSVVPRAVGDFPEEESPETPPLTPKKNGFSLTGAINRGKSVGSTMSDLAHGVNQFRTKRQARKTGVSSTESAADPDAGVLPRAGPTPPAGGAPHSPVAPPAPAAHAGPATPGAPKPPTPQRSATKGPPAGTKCPKRSASAGGAKASPAGASPATAHKVGSVLPGAGASKTPSSPAAPAAAGSHPPAGKPLARRSFEDFDEDLMARDFHEHHHYEHNDRESKHGKEHRRGRSHHHRDSRDREEDVDKRSFFDTFTNVRKEVLADRAAAATAKAAAAGATAPVATTPSVVRRDFEEDQLEARGATVDTLFRMAGRSGKYTKGSPAGPALGAGVPPPATPPTDDMAMRKRDYFDMDIDELD